MSGIDFLADTNFLIYLLEGRSEAALFADFSFAISFVTEIELLGRKGISASEQQVIQELLDSCFIIDLHPAIKAKAISLKQVYAIKLPDALVAATAYYSGLPLLTADRGFASLTDLNLVLITLDRSAL
ncbi:type II toxin-antitoxin system VapC family toxin [Nostoc sp. CHAB 5834]|nr:type II toxin-antitoxin system VapC family toxin [Nostoc sp. CHAB 5834]